jgi:hypothetical protein
MPAVRDGAAERRNRHCSQYGGMSILWDRLSRWELDPDEFRRRKSTQRGVAQGYATRFSRVSQVAKGLGMAAASYRSRAIASDAV